MSRAARIISTAFITAALVIGVELGVTLIWAEPVTNLEGWSAQQDASDELDRIEREYRLPNGEAFDESAVPMLAGRLRRASKAGDPIGRIKIPEIDINTVAVEGTDTESLKIGPGHYPRKGFPGEPGTTAFAGHRTTYTAPFRYVNRLERGDPIYVEMPYATFTYETSQQRIVPPSAVEVVRDRGFQQLVLTACHPPYSAAERIVIFARLTDIGPPADARAVPLPEIASPGLWPTIAALIGLLIVCVLMWLTSGRRRV